jgi:sterol desaturase/sphingolipid hydroxylase (fatty acid hydroxylase superfamily)
MTQPRSGLLNAALLLGGVAALLWLERKRPLREPVEAKLPRIARNAAVGAITAATVSRVERPIVTRVARIAEAREWGLLPRLALPPRLRTLAALVLMDYTLYWWHVLLHRVPILWRLHEPHHADRDLDASTALRFHVLEFLASVPWRCAQIALIGVTPRELELWQRLTFAEVLFHHSNVRLPRALEAWLARIVVTPRLHGIHHSIVREERDSNYSSGLTLWDALHRTARIEIDRDDVTIGLPDFRGASDVTLTRTLVLPLTSDSSAADERR